MLPSAIDIVSTPYKGTNVINYYDSLSYLDTSIVSKYLIAFEAVSKTISIGITITAPALKFTFSDDTVAYAVFDFVDSDGIAHMKFTKIIVKDGLEIDLTKEDNPFDKTYDVSSLSLITWQSLLTAFKAYGLAVNVADTSKVPKGTIIIIDCSNSTETVCRNPL